MSKGLKKKERNLLNSILLVLKFCFTLTFWFYDKRWKKELKDNISKSGILSISAKTERTGNQT